MKSAAVYISVEMTKRQGTLLMFSFENENHMDEQMDRGTDETPVQQSDFITITSGG